MIVNPHLSGLMLKAALGHFSIGRDSGQPWL
jgi:hypothetical protein